MTRQERIAWYNMAVIMAALVAFGLLVPAVGPHRAAAAFSIVALIALVPLFAWRRRGSIEVLSDERDRLIITRATMLGYSVFWLFFVLTCMSLWAIYQEAGVMPVELLPMVVWLGYSILQLVSAVATIVQYRRASHDAHA